MRKTEDEQVPAVTDAYLASAQVDFSAGSIDVWALVAVEKRHFAARAALHADAPIKRGLVVRDHAGDAWRRGNTRWTCLSPVDGTRIHSVGRLTHGDLISQYGPVVEIGDVDGWHYETIRPRR